MTAPIKRLKGRPVRGKDDVGREKLLEATRAILRAPIPHDISRKAVADAAGVTPALVSYYFPERRSLVAAATGPLIGARIDSLLAIVGQDSGFEARLRQIVTLLVGLCDTEAHLVDHTVDACLRQDIDAALQPMLATAYRRLIAFYLEGVDAGAWRHLDPDCFLHALWGMCKSLSHARPPCAMVSRDASAPDRRVETILDLTLHGLRREAPMARPA